jgi:hypothetical protein
VPIVLLAASCGDDGGGEPVDPCPNCQYWTQLTFDTGEFPAVHPSDANIIAYSSTRANPTLGTQDIWIRVANPDTAYYRITDDQGDERLPAWSPDGTRLAFARIANGVSDIWVVDVSSFTNPTDLERITSSQFEFESDPGRSAWRNDDTLLFTDGDDIFSIDVAGGSSSEPEEIVRDPADAILGLGLRFTESAPTYVRDQATTDELIGFTSDGRGPQGNIFISACSEIGEEVHANIFVDQKPLRNPAGDTLKTPVEIFGLAPGQYVVGVIVVSGPDVFCDTTLSQTVTVDTNQVAQSPFEFTRPRGAIRVLSPTGLTTSIGVARVEFEADTIKMFSERDYGTVQAETTFIDCLLESFYFLRLRQAAVVKDSGLIQVFGRKLSQICLTPASGGCPAELDSAGIDTLIYVPEGPPCPPGGAASGTFMAKAPADLAPAQEPTDLWVYNISQDVFRRLTNDNADQQYPAFSPDGRHVAYIENTQGERVLRIINVETIAKTAVPLPGRPGSRICNRAVAHPCWTPSGQALVVSLSNCDDEVEEVTNVWVVDVSGFLP